MPCPYSIAAPSNPIGQKQITLIMPCPYSMVNASISNKDRCCRGTTSIIFVTVGKIFPLKFSESCNKDRCCRGTASIIFVTDAKIFPLKFSVPCNKDRCCRGTASIIFVTDGKIFLSRAPTRWLMHQ